MGATGWSCARFACSLVSRVYPKGKSRAFLPLGSNWFSDSSYGRYWMDLRGPPGLLGRLAGLPQWKKPSIPAARLELVLSEHGVSYGRYWMDLRGPSGVLGRLAGLPKWKKPSIPAARLELVLSGLDSS